MSKRDKPVKKRKRMNWKARFKDCRRVLEIEIADLFAARAELTRYCLICDWACQRIEKLENGKQSLQCDLFFSRAAFTAIVEKHAQVIQEVHQLEADVLRQRNELIKLRGASGERVSCQR